MKTFTIDRARLIETLIELCRIPSPSGLEGAVREYIRERLDSMGYPSAVDDAGNLFTRTDSTMLDDMFLSCHMDTVPIPEGAVVQVVRNLGRISSDGRTILGGDDKQGVAAALEMLALCAENPGRHRGLDVVFTIREEQGALGSAAINSDWLRGKNGFNLDGESPPGSVINRAPKKSRFRCRVHGKSAHAALAPEDGVNAIVIAGSIIAALPLGVPGPESTSNVGSISGGNRSSIGRSDGGIGADVQTNVVPDLAEFSGELRSFSPEEFNQIQQKIDNICLQTSQKMGGSAEIHWEPTYESYHIKESETCVRWFTDACAGRGIKPEFISSRGGGDSNQLNNKGLRNLVFGLGMHNIHSNHEYVIEAEFCDAVELLRDIVFPKTS